MVEQNPFMYEKGKILGEGTYAKVYETIISADGKRGALKIIEIQEENQQIHEIFIQREIVINENLDHPNIVKMFDYYELPDKPEIHLIMELCDGSLEEKIQKAGDSERNVMEIFKGIIEGLKYLYTSKIFHRDIKPGNILIKDGVYKITDFGFGKSPRDMGRIFRQTRSIGTPLYESIENLLNQDYSTKHDVWSTGVMLYQVLFGTFPMGEYLKDFNTKEELIQRIVTLNLQFPPSNPISDDLKKILRGMLGIYERDRWDWPTVFENFEKYYKKCSGSVEAMKLE